MDRAYNRVKHRVLIISIKLSTPFPLEDSGGGVSSRGIVQSEYTYLIINSGRISFKLD